jgi:hypothetical protein
MQPSRAAGLGILIPLIMMAVAATAIAQSAEPVATPPLSPQELIAQFKAAPLQEQVELLVHLEREHRSDLFGLLLAAMEVQEGRILGAVDRMLPEAKPTEPERREANKLIERLHGRLALASRVRAARLAAFLGEARGFDWALECLQDYLDSGQPIRMECTNLPIGVPRDVPMIFLNFDRPGLANFLRLVRKGERPEALRGVARVMAPRNDQGHIVVPLDARTMDVQAFRKGLAEIATPLAREIEAILSKEVKRPAGFDPLAGLTEAERMETLKAEVTEKDFVIEVRREPFSEPDQIEFRLRKITPGLVGWKNVTALQYWQSTLPNGEKVVGGIGRGIGGRPPGGHASQGETVHVNSYRGDLNRPDAVLTETFTITLMSDRQLQVSAKFTADQLHLDPARDVDEFLRRLESTDPRESYQAEERFTWSSWSMPKLLAENGSARLRVVQGLMKRVLEEAAKEFTPQKEEYVPLDINRAPGYGGPLLRCLDSLNYLGVKNVPMQDFKALMQARNFWAARWGCEKLRRHFHNEKNSWDGADERINDLLRDQTKSKDPYAARNAAALLRRAQYDQETTGGLRGEVGDFSALIGPLLKNESSMVRIAGALLVTTNDKYKTREGEVVALLEPVTHDPEPRVVRAAVMGLAGARNLAEGEQKARLKLLTGLAHGEPWQQAAVAEAIEESLRWVKDSTLVPVLYEALRNSDRQRVWLTLPLDAPATAFLQERLAADPRDVQALWMLFSSGHRWPPETRIGRLQAVRGGTDAPKDDLGWTAASAAERLLAADPDDQRAAAALAADLRKHLKGGDNAADVDCLALAALGIKTDIPAEEFGPYGHLSLPAILLLFATDPASARDPIAAMLHYVDDRSDTQRILLNLDKRLPVPNKPPSTEEPIDAAPAIAVPAN